jgi:hypothetical protein
MSQTTKITQIVTEWHRKFAKSHGGGVTTPEVRRRRLAATRRFLPTFRFKPPPEAPSAGQFAGHGRPLCV